MLFILQSNNIVKNNTYPQKSRLYVISQGVISLF